MGKSTTFKKLCNAVKANMEVTSGRIDRKEPEAAMFHGFLGNEENGFKEYVVTIVPTDLAPQEEIEEEEEK